MECLSKQKKYGVIWSKQLEVIKKLKVEKDMFYEQSNKEDIKY